MKKRLQAWGDNHILPIVCALVFNQSGEILLLQRHPEDLGGGMWGFPGGRFEPGEKAIDAVKREVREETGVVLSEPKLVALHELRMPHGTVHMTTFQEVLAEEKDIILDPNEHTDHIWLHPNAVVSRENLLYGVPTLLYDYGLLEIAPHDATLGENGVVTLLKKI